MRSLILLLLVAAASAKVFQRCEWARTLKAGGMDGYQNVSLADWVCLSKWESSYDTMKKHRNSDGSTDFGIFQINSNWWCNDHVVSSQDGCSMECSELLGDDVTAAIQCAKRVVLEQGIRAWYGWRHHCDGRDVRAYVEGCGL